MAEGIAYYIPPEFRRMGKSAMDLLSAIDPAQGIMRGMAASGRAFDSELPADERKAAAIEAGVETLFPVGMIGMGAAAKQPAKAVLMDILTPTGATKDIAEDTLADPSRRKFLQGAAAAVPVAAVAPDVITDVMTKATKAGARAAINPLDMAMQNIRILRGQIDEQYGIVDEVLDNPRSSGMLPGERVAIDDANAMIMRTEQEIIDEAYEAMINMDPADFSQAIRGASDEALEEIVSVQYDSIAGNQRLANDGPNITAMAEEMQRRGMHTAKDRNGVSRFPNAETFVMDVTEPIVDSGVDQGLIIEKMGVDYPAGLNMTRQTPPDIEEDILELKLTELRREIANADRVMRIDGKSTKEIDEFKAQKRREMFELQNLPPDMDDFYAKGGAVEGVGSLSRVARDMFRGPRGIATLSRFATGGKAESKQSFNEMMSSLQNDLSDMSSSEFESAYGQSKSQARNTLDMLIAQRYHGASYEDGIPSAYRIERDAQLAQERMMGEAPPEPVISETSGMIGVDEDGNLVEYGTSYDVAEFSQGGDVDMSAYREALIASESSGDVGAENPSGAVGLTQAMPDTLEDFKDDTGLEFTPEQYANSRELQTQFQDWYEQKTINYIMDQGLDRYIGQTIKGVPITMSSMLGMAHLGGDYGMRKFLETGGRYDPDDGYTKLSDYGRKFANMSIVGQGSVGVEPSGEEIVKSMPVEQEAEFTDPRGYSPIPQLRPQYMPTEPMPRPRLRPTDEEETPQGIPSVAGVIPGRRTNLYEQYGGIASLTNP